jgi:hypothetical protein
MKTPKTPILLACTATFALAAYTAAEDSLKSQEPADARPAPTKEAATNAESKTEAKTEAAETDGPKPLKESVLKALGWLAEHQHSDGGWGQGGGWRVNTSKGGGRVEGAEDPSDVGNTAIALKAFLRAGTVLDSGDFAETASKAAGFLLAQVEKADDDSLYVTAVRGTQLQSKIGPYVDTFLAMQVLADLKGHMPDKSAEERRARCLDKLAAKVKKHQKDDGSFDGNVAWAATVSQGIASRALNSAWAAGAPIDDKTLERDHDQNATGLDDKSGKVKAGAGGVSDAGVAIYRYASKLGGMADFSKNNDKRRAEFEQTLNADDASDESKTQAREEIAKIDKAEAQKDVLLENVAGQVQQDGFVAGFGSNGGEEFVSYMNIAESLHAKGGKPWNEWQSRMDGIIKNAQHNDGSWSGQHCITGRTFCTSTALLTLTADRVEIAANEK